MKERYNELVNCKVVGDISMANVLDCYGVKSTTERFVDEHGRHLTRCWRVIKIRGGNKVDSYQVMYVVKTDGPRRLKRESLLFRPIILPTEGVFHGRPPVLD